MNIQTQVTMGFDTDATMGMKSQDYMVRFLRRLCDALEQTVWFRVGNGPSDVVRYLAGKGIDSVVMPASEYYIRAKVGPGIGILDDEVVVFTWYNWHIMVCEDTFAYDMTTGLIVS